jgi:hypothetical protein
MNVHRWAAEQAATKKSSLRSGTQKHWGKICSHKLTYRCQARAADELKVFVLVLIVTTGFFLGLKWLVSFLAGSREISGSAGHRSRVRSLEIEKAPVRTIKLSSQSQ